MKGTSSHAHSVHYRQIIVAVDGGARNDSQTLCKSTKELRLRWGCMCFCTTTREMWR